MEEEKRKMGQDERMKEEKTTRVEGWESIMITGSEREKKRNETKVGNEFPCLLPQIYLYSTGIEDEEERNRER